MKKTGYAKAIILAWTIIGSACATVAPVGRLPMPPRPVLPPVAASEFHPRGDGTFIIKRETLDNIVRRDFLRREYAEQLETVIRESNKTP